MARVLFVLRTVFYKRHGYQQNASSQLSFKSAAVLNLVFRPRKDASHDESCPTARSPRAKRARLVKRGAGCRLLEKAARARPPVRGLERSRSLIRAPCCSAQPMGNHRRTIWTTKTTTAIRGPMTSLCDYWDTSCSLKHALLAPWV